VDDVDAVRNVAKHIALRAGFSVLTAVDGVKALDLFREHIDEIDVVLLDLVMPRMGGRDVFREMQRLRPDIPVILTSGYNQETTLQDLEGVAGFLKKPFRGARLIDMLETAIRSKTASS
jgi:CheY-like chemotaxis protein